jgi:two-component system, chemotaxis family, response regulator Rcp1
MKSPEDRAVALVVEDNRADVFLIKEAIRHHQLAIDLLVVSDGDRAYEFITEVENYHVRCPDVVLLDLNLPTRSGREVLQRLRQSPRCADTPVLIVTSSDLPKEREELCALGANSYFCKPSGYEEFLKVGMLVQELLASHRPGCG